MGGGHTCLLLHQEQVCKKIDWRFYKKKGGRGVLYFKNDENCLAGLDQRAIELRCKTCTSLDTPTISSKKNIYNLFW